MSEKILNIIFLLLFVGLCIYAVWAGTRVDRKKKELPDKTLIPTAELWRLG